MNNELALSTFSTVLNDGVDLLQRRIYLCGDIDEESISQAIRSVWFLNSMSTDAPIEVWISTYGGELDEAFALYDTLNRVDCPVHTHVTGKCMSAGPLLLLAGDRRTCEQHSQFMFHAPQLHGAGPSTPQDMRRTADATARVTSAYVDELAYHTLHPRPYWERILADPGDTYLSAQQALNIGLIDRIV